jgi:VanZ family protein
VRSLPGAWVPVAAWCALVFILSSLPLRVDAGVVPGGDKTAHVGEYAVLGFLLARALRNTRPALGRAALVAGAALLGALYGATDEFHQSTVPERTASLGDLAADGIGALLGAVAFAALPAIGSPAPPIGARPGPGARGVAPSGVPSTPRDGSP